MKRYHQDTPSIETNSQKVLIWARMANMLMFIMKQMKVIKLMSEIYLWQTPVRNLIMA